MSKSSSVKGDSLAKLCPFLDKLVDLSPQAEINSAQLKTAVMSTLVKDPSLNSSKIKNDVWACCRVDKVITALNHLRRLIDPERWMQCCSSGESVTKLKQLLAKVKLDFGSDAQPISPEPVPLPYVKQDPEPSSEHDKVEEENEGVQEQEQEPVEQEDKGDAELTPAKPPKRLRSKMSTEELQQLFFSPTPATPTTKTTINSSSSTIKTKASSGSACSKESSGSASSSSSNEKVVYIKEYYKALNKYGFKKTLPGQKAKHMFILSGGLLSKEQLTALADKVLKDLSNCRNEAEENEVELIAKFKLQA